MRMHSLKTTSLFTIVLVVIALSLLPAFGVVVFAQDLPAAETPTVEPPTETPTPTNTPTATNTPTVTPSVTPSATPTSTQIPPEPTPPAPVSIPEPVTTILFGTGLAALSAAVAARRKKG